MLVLKKSSRLGRKALARAGSLVVGDSEAPEQVDLGQRVRIVGGDHAGREGRVRWLGENEHAGRVGVAVPRVAGLVFVGLPQLREVGRGE